jgi:hypothetical protein
MMALFCSGNILDSILFFLKLKKAKPCDIIEMPEHLSVFYEKVLLERARPLVKFRRYSEIPKDTSPFMENEEVSIDKQICHGVSPIRYENHGDCRGCGAPDQVSICKYCGRVV